jgi:malate synthase
VPLYNLMEDAATAEISRAQVWQWMKHGASLDDGSKVDAARFSGVVDEEMKQIREEVGQAKFEEGRFADARALFERMSTSDSFGEFLTLPAYAELR